MKRIAVPVLIMLAVAGCAAVNTSPDVMDKVWSTGHVFLPGDPSLQTTRMEMQDWKQADARFAGKKLPALIWLHSCAGYYDDGYGGRLAEAGFAVFAPNSFARPGRGTFCDGQTSGVQEMRHEEVRDALLRIRGLPWIDQDKLFLAGFSEGGIATGTWRGDEFAGYIVVGWACRTGMAGYDQVNIPTRRPALFMIGSEDRSYRNFSPTECAAQLGGRSSARLMILPGQGHVITRLPEVHSAMVSFAKTIAGVP